MKKVSLTVINDLVTDNRVHKVAVSLMKMGFEPVLIGRVLPDSLPVSRVYETRRLRLLFRKGFLFYLEYNFRLLILFLTTKIDVFVANDLDTLTANYLASRIKRKPLIYDSHEYFTELPELVNRPFVKWIWSWLERKMVPKVDAAYTVCESIAEVYVKLYDVDFKVVRNLPNIKDPFALTDGIDENKIPKVVLYQGSLNLGRGLETVIQSMLFLENAELWIAGGGDIAGSLKKLADQLKLNDRVKFLGRLPLDEIEKITCRADLGISLEEDLGLNYRYALPNKLFDYIKGGIPVLVSNLPEMRKVIEHYQIGAISQSNEPEQLAEILRHALFDQEIRAVWRKNLIVAAKELCWEREEDVLFNIYSRFI